MSNGKRKGRATRQGKVGAISKGEGKGRATRKGEGKGGAI